MTIADDRHVALGAQEPLPDLENAVQFERGGSGRACAPGHLPHELPTTQRPARVEDACISDARNVSCRHRAQGQACQLPCTKDGEAFLAACACRARVHILLEDLQRSVCPQIDPVPII